MDPKDVEKMLVRCRHCNRFEYWAEMRWRHGFCFCRKCYKAVYESETGKLYEWDDLDGPTPSAEEIAAAMEAEQAHAAIGRG